MSEVNKPLNPTLLKQLKAGVRLGDAVRSALGGSIPKWALSKGLSRVVAAQTIYSKRTPNDDVVKKLTEDLGGTRDEWLQLLWEAARPVAAVAGR